MAGPTEGSPREAGHAFKPSLWEGKSQQLDYEFNGRKRKGEYGESGLQYGQSARKGERSAQGIELFHRGGGVKGRHQQYKTRE